MWHGVFTFRLFRLGLHVGRQLCSRRKAEGAVRCRKPEGKLCRSMFTSRHRCERNVDAETRPSRPPYRIPLFLYGGALRQKWRLFEADFVPSFKPAHVFFLRRAACFANLSLPPATLRFVILYCRRFRVHQNLKGPSLPPILPRRERTGVGRLASLGKSSCLVLDGTPHRSCSPDRATSSIRAGGRPGTR